MMHTEALALISTYVIRLPISERVLMLWPDITVGQLLHIQIYKMCSLNVVMSTFQTQFLICYCDAHGSWCTSLEFLRQLPPSCMFFNHISNIADI